MDIHMKKLEAIKSTNKNVSEAKKVEKELKKKH